MWLTVPVASTGRRGSTSAAALNFYECSPVEAGLRTAVAGHTAAAARSIAVVARILIVGGGCRGLALARELHDQGHALRVVTRREQRRAAIEAAGAECFVGDPNRLVTLRAALEHVTIACWLLATASGAPEDVQALHGSRLEQFMGSLIDTTVRGVIYEAGRSELPAAGERTVIEKAERNAIPVAILRSDPSQAGLWMEQAREAVGALLAGALS